MCASAGQGRLSLPPSQALRTRGTTPPWDDTEAVSEVDDTVYETRRSGEGVVKEVELSV